MPPTICTFLRNALIVLILVLAGTVISAGQAINSYPSACSTNAMPCNYVEWLRNRTNTSVAPLGVIQKTTAASNNSTGGHSSQYLQNVGDSFTWQISSIGGYIGLSYNPALSTANTNANFAWNILTLSSAQVYTGAAGATLTGLNLSGGQKLRLAVDAASRILFQYETTIGSGVYTTFFTSTTPITGKLYPFCALNGTAGVINAQVCKP